MVRQVDVRLHPTRGATDTDLGGLRLSSRPLRHGVDTLGWRLQEPDGRRMDPARLAAERGHLTAQEAGRIAATAGARRLVLTHFSQRYDDPAAFGVEARRYHDDTVVGEDLLRVAMPERAT